MSRLRRVAALYDIHGNLPALEAVLVEVERARVDLVLVGGDVMPGPMPREVLERLDASRLPTQWIKGNGDRECLAEVDGRVSPMPEAVRTLLRWSRDQLTAVQLAAVAAWPPHVRLALAGLGSVFFCHATPRNDEEIITQAMPDALLRPVFADAAADLVVCGHTHIQFDRHVGATRVINAGSVGMPFQKPGAAYWLLLGEGVELRRTEYDLHAAAATMRRSAYPGAEEFARVNVLEPPDMLEPLTAYGLAQLGGEIHGT